MKAGELERLIAEIHRSAKESAVTVDQLRRLRAALAELPEEQAVTPLERAALRNARIMDTQIRDVAERLEDGIVDQASFATLPPSLQKRILERIERMPERLDSAASREPATPDYKTGVFQCLGDFEACRKSGRSQFTCGLLLTTCVLGGIFSVKVSTGG